MKIKKEHRNILIGLSIGDGYINKNGYLDIWHSPKQKDLVDYKYSLVKDYCNIIPYTRTFKNGFQSYGFRTKNKTFLRLLRRVMYKDGKKKITRKLLNRLSLKELAIWWMDDGNKSIKYNKKNNKIRALVFRLSTCTTKEQNQIIIDWLFETYGVKFGQTKDKNHYSLICGTKEGKKLSVLLLPYIIPSMRYKIFIL